MDRIWKSISVIIMIPSILSFRSGVATYQVSTCVAFFRFAIGSQQDEIADCSRETHWDRPVGEHSCGSTVFFFPQNNDARSSRLTAGWRRCCRVKNWALPWYSITGRSRRFVWDEVRLGKKVKQKVKMKQEDEGWSFLQMWFCKSSEWRVVNFRVEEWWNPDEEGWILNGRRIQIHSGRS